MSSSFGLTAVLTIGTLIGETATLGHIPGFEQDAYKVNFYNYGEREKADAVDSLELPDAVVYKLSAFAVSRITGVVPVEGRYFNNRSGPVDCDYTLTLQLPFVAEVIMPLGDVAVQPSEPDKDGRYDAVATVKGNFAPFNPRIKLDSAEHNLDSDPGLCRKGSPEKFLMDMWKVGYASVQTAANCLTKTDARGAEGQTLNQLYQAGLAEDIKTLMPKIKNLEIRMPTNTASTASNDPYGLRLAEAIKEVKDGNDRHHINAKPVEECNFQSLTIDTGLQANEV